MIRILFICHGNICRSPMAEYVMRYLAESRGEEKFLEIASAATSAEELGNPVYPPAQEALRRRGIGRSAYTDFSGKRARQVTRDDYAHYDLLVCADPFNVKMLLRLLGADPEGRVRLLLDFSEKRSRHGQAVADPWYSGDFETAFRDIEEGVRGLLCYCEQRGFEA